jgi:hypothetical protein
MDSSIALFQQKEENAYSNINENGSILHVFKSFSPLTKLNENQADDISLTSDCEQSYSTSFIETITVQSSASSKTPTIINGRIVRC